MMDRAHLTENETGRYLSVMCPGCGHPHTMTLIPNPGGRGWAFDGDLVRPTVTPSLSVNARGKYHVDGAHVCHSWIKNGRIRFLPDTTHRLSGREVDLPPYPENWK